MLSRREGRELQDNFPDLRRLFDFARKNLDPDMSMGRYFSHENQSYEPPVLPETLHTLVASHPGAYFVVGYDDRTSSRYDEQIRDKEALLSTSKTHYGPDNHIREISFREPAADKRDQHRYMRVTEMVNNESILQLNTAGSDRLERPHGDATVQYVLKPNGERTIVESVFNRLDEGMFEWQGEQKPVRWLRKLELDVSKPQPTVTYRDTYMIGRRERPGDRVDSGLNYAAVQTRIEGAFDAPHAVVVEIGIPGSGDMRDVYRDRRLTIRMEENPVGEFKHQSEILKQDPIYALLRQSHIDTDRFIREITGRMRLLQEDWAKQQSVFGVEIASEARRELPRP